MSLSLGIAFLSEVSSPCVWAKGSGVTRPLAEAAAKRLDFAPAWAVDLVVRADAAPEQPTRADFERGSAYLVAPEDWPALIAQAALACGWNVADDPVLGAVARRLAQTPPKFIYLEFAL